MNARLIISLVSIIMVAGILFGSGLYSGYMYCKSGEASGVVKRLKKDSQSVDKIEAQAEVRYVTVEKIKEVIRKVPDRTGCLDTPTPDDFNSGLYEAYSKHP